MSIRITVATLSVLILLAPVFCNPLHAQAKTPVSAELGKASAWTGEAVPLIITLRSPGPFSGTASFDFPETPKTTVLKMGRPVVGSEGSGDESVITQRHEFAIYTQQSGQVVIPSFPINFEGKKSFTGEAEPMTGLTGPLTFESKRPPGTESMGLVVATTEMSVAQSWTPSDFKKVATGDVVIRTIKRTATGTTAMMLPPIKPRESEGVRIYFQQPTVVDRSQRGEAQAERIDIIKYQFEQPGIFTIPDIEVTWWDPSSSSLKSETLKGQTVNAEGIAKNSELAETPESSSSRWMLATAVLLAALLAWFTRKPVLARIAEFRAERNSIESRSASQLLEACKSGLPQDAFTALQAWKRSLSPPIKDAWSDIVNDGDGAMEALMDESKFLSKHLFQAGSNKAPWCGRNLGTVFPVVRKHLKTHQRRKRKTGNILPSLNPAD